MYFTNAFKEYCFGTIYSAMQYIMGNRLTDLLRVDDLIQQQHRLISVLDIEIFCPDFELNNVCKAIILQFKYIPYRSCRVQI